MNHVGGGAVIIIRLDLKSLKTRDLTVIGIKAVWCKINIQNTNILVSSIYIPPDDDTAMNPFTLHLQKVSSHRNISIVSDFNAKHPQWYNSRTNNLRESLNKSVDISLYSMNDELKHTKIQNN